MKKLFLLLLVFPLFFIACSDDDDPDYSKDIIGQWNFSKVTDMVFETNNRELNKLIKEGLKGADFSTMMPADVVGSYSFNDQYDYLMEEAYGDFQRTEKGKYKLEGRKLFLQPENGYAEKWTIEISGTRMLFTVEANGKLLDDIIETSSKNDPEFKKSLEEMEMMGVKINNICVTTEMKKK